PDFDAINFTQDGAWHELDLSGIIPVGVKAVSVRIKIGDAVVQKRARFRAVGDTNTLHTCEIHSQVSNFFIVARFDIGVDSNRKIEYYIDAPGISTLQLVIRAWWF
ncbi:unnamed protein product, partial [marine sediment metagenome]